VDNDVDDPGPPDGSSVPPTERHDLSTDRPHVRHGHYAARMTGLSTVPPALPLQIFQKNRYRYRGCAR